MEIEELAVERPEALAKIPVDAIDGVDAAKAARDRRRRASSRPRCSTRSPTCSSSCGRRSSPRTPRWSRSTRWCATPRARSSRSTARSRSTTTPPSATRQHAELVDNAAEDPLEAKAKAKHLNYVKLDGQVGIIGNGAGLVMSTLDVVAYAGEKHGGRQAGQLPRHRRRRVGRGDGQRPGDHPGRPGRAQRCSSTSSAASPPATRSPTASCRRCEILGDGGRRKPLVVRLDGNNVDEGRRILAEAEPPARAPWSTPWTTRPTRPPSSQLRGRETMAIFLTEHSKVIVQGITGSEGTKHTARMLAAGTNIVGGVNPRKAGQKVDFDGTVAAGLRHRRRGDGGRPAPTSPSCSCRRRSPRPP